MELFGQNGPADAFSRIFNKVVRFVPEDIFQILSHGDVRAPFRGMDAVFQNQRVVVHNTGGGKADTVEIFLAQTRLLQQGHGLLPDKGEGDLRGGGNDPGEGTAAKLLQVHTEEGQTQGFRPQGDGQQILPGAESEELRPLAALFGGFALSGADKDILAAEELNGPHDGQFADAGAGYHICDRMFLMIPEAGQDPLAVLVFESRGNGRKFGGFIFHGRYSFFECSPQ